MSLKKILAVTSVSVLAGCYPSPKEIKTTVDFNKEVASIINQKGKATVSGQAFLKQSGGGVVTCAGSEVSLFPVTEYAKQRITAIYGTENGGYKKYNPYTVTKNSDNEDYNNYSRSATCDAEGDFSFTSLADGEYYITTIVYWRVGDYNQGGFLSRRVNVNNGKDLRVLLSY